MILLKFILKIRIMKLDDEFKVALRGLPEKEKDKLIFRLIKHDLALANRLRFELLAEYTIEESRENIKNEIRERMVWALKHAYNVLSDLWWDIRDFSGKITNHVSITRDKYGEVELLIFLMREALQTYSSIEDSSLKHPTKLHQYIINKLMKILLLIQKLDPDFQSDFKDDLIEVQRHMGQSHLLMKLSIFNGFDVNWLDLDRTPDDLQKIYKESRARGYYSNM
jgi:hypothetical protein